MKKTRCNRAHHELKARMVDFTGWEMPVQYSGITQEHMAVRNAGGIFDVSHMGEIFITGPEALAAVQYITSNDASKLVPGKIQYAGLLNEKGGFVDDLLVHMVNETEYLLVVNASNVDKDYNHIKETISRFDAKAVNASDEYSQISVQGPLAEKLLAQFTDVNLADMKYYYFKMGKAFGLDMLISRTGYTGEDGFEIYFKSDENKASEIFLELVNKGADMGILPIGLGARDTLRLEAKMALYGNDIDADHTVLEADLAWILKLEKGDFIGKSALAAQKESGITRKLVGFEMIEPGIARHGYQVKINGEIAGEVCSGTMSPLLKKAIGMAYVPVSHSLPGSELKILIREKEVAARVAVTPFYKRAK